jgi:hypothetical protein
LPLTRRRRLPRRVAYSVPRIGVRTLLKRRALLGQHEQAIETTRHEKDLGLYEGDDAGYFARLERLTQRRRELESLPSTPSGFEWRDVGETYAQAWARMDASQLSCPVVILVAR